MATLVSSIFVIENTVTRRLVVDGVTGDALEFASVPAARLAMRDLGLSPRHYRITEPERD